MRFIFIIIVLGCIGTSIHGTDTEDISKLSDHQIDRLCSKVNKMKLMRQDEIKIKKFIQKEIIRMNNLVIRTKVEGEGNDHGYMYDDGHRIDLKSNDEIGQSGHHVEIKLIGTDSSVGSYAFTHVSQQTNNDVRKGDLSDFFINAYPTLNLRDKILGIQNSNTKGNWHPTLMANREKAYVAPEYCRRMIESVYNQVNRKMSSILPTSKANPMDLGNEVSESPQQRSDAYSRGNSTSIDTRMRIGPDGFGTYISHIGTGESRIIGTATDVENAVHGNYKYSTVSLFELNQPILVSG